MMPIKLSVSDATICSITLEVLVMILEASFMLIRRSSMRQALNSFSVFQTMIKFSTKERVYIQKGLERHALNIIFWEWHIKSSIFQYCLQVDLLQVGQRNTTLKRLFMLWGRKIFPSNLKRLFQFLWIFNFTYLMIFTPICNVYCISNTYDDCKWTIIICLW